MRTLGERVRVKREKAGISQSELGRLTGLSQRKVSWLESGRQAWLVLDLFKVAPHIGTTPLALLRGVRMG